MTDETPKKLLPAPMAKVWRAISPYVSTFLLAVAAGIFIGIGGTVLLSIEDRVIGALMFSIALLCICYMGLYLFTGKVGYLVPYHSGSDILTLLVGLVGNGVGCFLMAEGVRVSCPNVLERCAELVVGKIDGAKSISSIFLAAVFCGILMFTAVYIYKSKNSVAAIFFCVPVFILSGFEHSIADMFYFFLFRFYVSSEYGSFGWFFLVIVILGNTVGGCVMPWLMRFAKKCERVTDEESA